MMMMSRLAIPLMLTLAVFAASAETAGTTERYCSTHIQYVIKDDAGRKMHDFKFERYWQLTCQQQLEIWYRTLDAIVGEGKKTFAELSGE